MGLIITLLICALIGWLAGVIMKSSYAWWINILLGIVGGWVGDLLLGSFFSGLGHIGFLSIGSIVTGVIGAVVVIFIVRLIRK